jgi:hypothetical protein
VFNAGNVETEAFGVGHAANAGQELVDRQRAPTIVTDQINDLLFSVHSNAGHIRITSSIPYRSTTCDANARINADHSS